MRKQVRQVLLGGGTKRFGCILSVLSGFTLAMSMFSTHVLFCLATICLRYSEKVCTIVGLFH